MGRLGRMLAGALLLLVLVWALRAGTDAWTRRSYAGEQAVHAAMSVDTLALLESTLRESSGLALSGAHPGVYWTHNDSGDGPRIYAFDGSGQVLRTFEVAGADARDWEDMDAGPCPSGTDAPAEPDAPATCLYVGDIGDNARARDVLTVYVVEEPDPRTAPDTVPQVGRLRFRYPDEPHDAELLAVHPGGALVVVTKGRTGSIVVFGLSAGQVTDALAADTIVTLPDGRPFPVEPNWDLERTVTGGAFRPDGAVLAVRTYTEIFFLPWPPAASGATVAARCWLGRADRVGEALAWEDPTTLLLASEASRNGPGTLLRVLCAEVGGAARP